MDPGSREKTKALDLRAAECSDSQASLGERLGVTWGSSCPTQGDAQWADSASMCSGEGLGRRCMFNNV